jgi:hypothetical protein
MFRTMIVIFSSCRRFLDAWGQSGFPSTVRLRPGVGPGIGTDHFAVLLAGSLL